MSHHADQMPEELRRELDFMKDKLGATGKFPDGKLHDTDEGEIQFAVASDKEKQVVILDFGSKPISYVGMGPQDAIELAQLLIRHARSVSREPLRIELA